MSYEDVGDGQDYIPRLSNSQLKESGQVNSGGGFYSAFTVAELGEMLPGKLKKDWWLMFSFDKDGRKYDVSYVRWNKDGGLNTQWNERGITEADACAKMIIYLLENKLLTNPTHQVI